MQVQSHAGVPANHSAQNAAVPDVTDQAGAGSARRQAFQAARLQWPELDVSFDAFSAHLDQLGYTRELPIHLGALYLCVACAGGCPLACRLLEQRHFPALRGYISRFDSRPDAIEDVLQQIRYRLLVGPKPRLQSYRGQGPFEAWLREVARSVSVDAIRMDFGRARRLRHLSEDVTCQENVHAVPPLAPDEQVFQQHYGRALASAVQRCLQVLPPEQRQLLHHYYVSGLSVDQLGAVYRVDRSTAARRIVRSVRSIQRALRKELSQLSSAPEVADLRSWVPVLCCGVDLEHLLGHEWEAARAS